MTGRFVGIDPGVAGGIAMLDASGDVLLAIKMPATDRDVLDVLRGDGPAHAVLERVSSSPGWGHAGSFTFGKVYGGLRMALAAAGIPFVEVTPLKWQRALSCVSRGDKNITKARAQALFPALKVTHHIADALLLAHYCRTAGLW